MNNSIANVTSIGGANISELTQMVYNEYVAMLVICATSSLLIYTTTLAIPQEMVYMWLSPKPFSISSVLYAFTRYGGLLNQMLDFWTFFVPPGSWCNILVYIDGALGVLAYVGVQGLLVFRAYTLCQGNQVMAIILALCFGGGFVSNMYVIITSGGCQGLVSLRAILIGNICTVLSDFFVFGICVWQVWGTWKLKRETGIRSRDDLVSVILAQTLSRFCFVISFGIAIPIIDQFNNSIATNAVNNIQQSLSVILLANFALDLRQQNSAAIQAADIKLPTIQFRSVANYIHRSILVEMGDHEISVSNTGTEENDDLSTESPDVGIGSGDEASSAAA